jgi:glycosidase
MRKMVIYQLFPRYFGNKCTNNVVDGDIQTNGCGKFEDIDRQALLSIKQLGVTCIWFTGILEHATKTDYTNIGILNDHPAIVKGKAGSPYAIKDYFDIDPDLAVKPENRMDEFHRLIERCHQNGLKVFIDFVPNHLARRYKSDTAPSGTRDFGADDRDHHAFNPSNNFYYLPGQKFEPQFDIFAGTEEPYTELPAKVTGNDCFTSKPQITDWYDTVKLNYGVDYLMGGFKNFNPIPSTWFKMMDVLTFWINKGVDGFRCDMAEMVPVEFWEWTISRIKKNNPSVIFIAEVYNPSLYREYINKGGFDFLYDKVGMYETLREVIEEKIPASAISNCWQNLNDILPHMLYFLENHDEQRIASPFFAGDPHKGIPALIISACMHVNPVMIYNGQELGESGMYFEGFSGLDGRNTIFDYWGIESLVQWNNEGRWDGGKLSTIQIGLRETYSRVLNIAITEKSIIKGQFFDLMYANYDNPGFDSTKNFAFIRKYEEEIIIITVSFSSQESHVSLNIPKHAFDYLEIPDGKIWKALNLLTDNSADMMLASDQHVDFDLPAYSGSIIKLL